jgi:hypothetical protein
VITSALPLVPSAVCPILDPLGTICRAANGIGSTVVSAGANDVLSALSNWVVSGATWLLDQIGGVLNSTTSIDLGASWFADHYRLMAGLAAVVVLPLLLVSVLQAVYRQSAGTLVRSALVQLPLALVLTAVAVQLVQLALGATDAMSTAIATGTGADLQSALSNLAGVLGSLAATGDAAVPAFVVLLGAMLVVAGSLLLWVELLVRAAAVYAAVLFLPLALASLVWPAVAHWCRRLVDTLVALVLSKFVIVAILSLAVSAVGAGSGASLPSVLAGGALLLLAAFSPFTLLRLIPMVEAGAAHQLEGARHRVQQAFGSLPRSAASYALARLAPVPALGGAGTGMGAALEAPGGAESGGPPAALAHASPSGATGSSEDPAGVANDALPAEVGGIPAWRGVAPPDLPTAAAPGVAAPGGTRRGPPPFIGAEGRSSVPSPTIETGSGPQPSAPAVVTVAGIGGTHALERDRLGPVIRWRPALPEAAPARNGIDAET